MKEEIKKFFRGDVEDSEETLFKYSHDASLLEVQPALVLFPKNSEDVKNLVQWVSINKDKYPNLAITPRCAGTDMSGGAIGESLILDFTRYMNNLVKFMDDIPQKPSSQNQQNSRLKTPPGVPGGVYADSNFAGSASTITVQPGMFYRDFEKLTLEKGLILPCYTASKSLNAVGGMYGNNSAGERTLKYGKTEDYALSAKVVFSDGNEYMVRPLSGSELNNKIAQGDYEGNVYKNIFELIKENEGEIRRAKPTVHKNSAGYYIWNVIKSSEENVSAPAPVLRPQAVAPARVFNPEETFRWKNVPYEVTSDVSVQKDSSTFLQPSAGTFRQQNPSPLTQIFDLNKLLVGSQGTLGIATEITFRLVPQIRHSKLVVIFMNDLEPLGRLISEILSLKPETLESYDDKTMRLAVKFFPDFLKNKGLNGMVRFMWSFLPELRMMLTGGFPKLIMLAEFAGQSEEEAHEKCLELLKRIKDFKLKVHITKSEAESGKYWDIRRESFALLRKHVKGMRTAPFIDDIIVRPEFLPKFIPELNAILGKYDLVYTLAGHAGDGNFHIIPLMDFSRPDAGEIIIGLGELVYELVARYRGSITAEHNDGLIRTPYLNKMYDPTIISIFSKIKGIFDPKNIFNPGKKVPSASGAGTKGYITAHLAVEHKANHKV